MIPSCKESLKVQIRTVVILYYVQSGEYLVVRLPFANNAVISIHYIERLKYRDLFFNSQLKFSDQNLVSNIFVLKFSV